MKRLLALCLLTVSAAALAADGDFDPAFGIGGVASLESPAPPLTVYTRALRVLAVPGDKAVVLVSHAVSPNYTPFASAQRLLVDGSRDLSFGVSGMFSWGYDGMPFLATDMKAMADGKIVSAGVSNDKLAVLRLTADGMPDLLFGSSAAVTVDLGSTVRRPRLAPQSDGKLLVLTTRYAGYSNWTELTLLRLDSTGALDPAFGTGGIAYTGIAGPNYEPQALALQGDGAIVVAYSRPDVLSPQSAVHRKVLARFSTTGAPDTSFGTAGEATIPLLAYAYDSDAALALLPDGRILVAGYSQAAKAQGVARVLATGALDAAFGTGGVALAPPGEVPDIPSAIAVLADGRFVTAGRARYGGGSTYARASVARYLPDGRLDPNFRGTGRLYEGTLLTGSAGAAIQPDGRVLVAGWQETNYNPDARVARLEGPAASEVVAGSSAKAVLSGESVDLTAQVFGASPTGTVDFRLYGSRLPACSDVVLVAGSASCPGLVLPAGANPITVTYNGDLDDPPAISPVWMQMVLSAGGDVDGDGVPDLVEAGESLDPTVKDNDVFAATARGARLFAMQQYRDFLGREGEEAGIAGWVNAITTGAWSRQQVIDAFLSSGEFAGFVAPVVRLYFATYLRIPDYLGLNFNAGLVRNGTYTLTQLATFFTGGPEFQLRYGSLDNTQFVTLLYSNVLGRAPDPAGLAGWLALMDSGYTRGQVLLGFSDSVEYQGAMANEVFVTMMYAGMLRRSPEPAGFADWVQYLDAGTYTREQVINGFFLSSEYRARFLP